MTSQHTTAILANGSKATIRRCKSSPFDSGQNFDRGLLEVELGYAYAGTTGSGDHLEHHLWTADGHYLTDGTEHRLDIVTFLPPEGDEVI